MFYSGWSNDGIKVTATNNTFIQCTSSHLTSFAVLVAPGGEVRYFVSVTAITCVYILVLVINRVRIAAVQHFLLSVILDVPYLLYVFC